MFNPLKMNKKKKLHLKIMCTLCNTNYVGLNQDK